MVVTQFLAKWQGRCVCTPVSVCGSVSVWMGVFGGRASGPRLSITAGIHWADLVLIIPAVTWTFNLLLHLSCPSQKASSHTAMRLPFSIGCGSLEGARQTFSYSPVPFLSLKDSKYLGHTLRTAPLLSWVPENRVVIFPSSIGNGVKMALPYFSQPIRRCCHTDLAWGPGG